MKSPEEFRNQVYEKHGVKLAVRKRRMRRAMVCVPLALLIVLSSVFLPRVLTGIDLPFARAGRIPLMLQVGRPADPTESKFADDLTSKIDKLEQERQRLLEEQEEEAARKAVEEMEKEVDDLRAKFKGEREISPNFSNVVNQFARDSAVLLSESFKDNACYSPLSMYYALALTSCGAGGKTKEEFQNILYAEDGWVANECGKYYRQHYHEDETGTFRLENSLWLDGNFAFGDKFISYAEDDFYSSLFQVDFSDPDLGNEMTKWVSDQTDGLLSPTFTFQDHQMLYLLNTILFEAEWNHRFFPENNTQGEFRKADGTTVTTEFMNQGYAPDGGYYKGDGFVSASLLLKSGDRMVFVLPDPGVSTEELISDPDLFDEMFLSEPKFEDRSALVSWSIPKFDFTCGYDMHDTLVGLGLHRAFDQVLADFSDMGKLEMYLSETSQDVRISVNENGVTAAAYTEMAFDETAIAYTNNTLDMVLDRPFLFAILSKDQTTEDTNSETLLFVGVCGDPTASGTGSAAAAS